MHKEQRALKKIFLYCQQCKIITPTTETRFKKEIINNFNTQRVENGQTRTTENNIDINQQNIELSPELVKQMQKFSYLYLEESYKRIIFENSEDYCNQCGG